jgi:CRISPR-associated protein Cas2
MVSDLFLLVAFDVSSDRRRRRIVKVLEKQGSRVNYSVFECMLTAMEAQKLKEDLARLMKPGKDNILVYPLCKNCVDKRISILGKAEREEVVKML